MEPFAPSPREPALIGCAPWRRRYRVACNTQNAARRCRLTARRKAMKCNVSGHRATESRQQRVRLGKHQTEVRQTRLASLAESPEVRRSRKSDQAVFNMAHDQEDPGASSRRRRACTGRVRMSGSRSRVAVRSVRYLPLVACLSDTRPFDVSSPSPSWADEDHPQRASVQPAARKTGE